MLRTHLALLFSLNALLMPYAHALSTCERYLSDPQSALEAGAKNYGYLAPDYALDEQTVADAKTNRLAAALDKELQTDMGRARLRYQLEHPLLNPEDIQQRQDMIKYIADDANWGEFEKIRAKLAELSEANEHFMTHFRNFAKEPTPLVTDVMWASVTYIAMFLPTIFEKISFIAKSPHHTAIQLGFILLGARTFGWWNKAAVVDKRRPVFDPYNGYLIAGKMAEQTLAEAPPELFKDMHDNIFTLYQGPAPSRASRTWLKLNGFFNPPDQDLADHLPDGPPAPLGEMIGGGFMNLLRRAVGKNVSNERIGPEDLAGLNRQIRLQYRIWSIPLPFTKKRWWLLPNTVGIADRYHWAQFWMRYLRSHIVAEKPALSRVFSGIAELDVMIAAAKIYRENKTRMTFPEILSGDAPTQFTAEEMHNPSYALEVPLDSAANDIALGHTPDGEGTAFTVVHSSEGSGVRGLVEGVMQTILLAQMGLPVFARSATLTPGQMMSAVERHKVVPGENAMSLDIQRSNQMLELSNTHPHSFAFVVNPFPHEDETLTASTRFDYLGQFIASNVVGIMVSQGPSLFKLIRGNKELSPIGLDALHFHPFDEDMDLKPDLPKVVYDRMIKAGLPAGAVDRIAKVRNSLRKRTFWNLWKDN